MSEQSQNSRTITGRVVSTKMDKTITIMVERLIKHPVYGKYIKRSTKMFAHDADNQCNEGDLVTVTPCRPISKNKTWVLLSVDEKATG